MNRTIITVIMDEASAAADPENEYELQQAFPKLTE